MGREYHLGFFTFAMVTASIIISLRSLPMQAMTGMNILFYFFITTIGFLLPITLILKLFGTAYPVEGGLYAWVKEAFGERWGFSAIFIQWMHLIIVSVLLLSFISSAIAYAFLPELSENKLFILIVSLIFFWGATIISMRGLKTSTRFSTICVIIGVFVPAVMIIGMAGFYLISEGRSAIDLSFTMETIIPDLASLSALAMMAAFVNPFFGIEASASHLGDLKNPKRSYLPTILIAGLFCVLVNTLCSLSIAVVIPYEKISFAAGLLQALSFLFDEIAAGWLLIVVILLIMAGTLGEINSWILAPARGMTQTARNGSLPRYMQYSNENGIPSHTLIVQAAAVSVFCIIFALIPGVNDAYWVLLSLLTHIYLVAYLILILSAIRQRDKLFSANGYHSILVKGIFWVISGIGIVTILGIEMITFLSPNGDSTTSNPIYIAGMAFLMMIIISIPLITYALRKPEWKAD